MDPFDLGPHAGFIIACYVITVAVIAGLIGWLLIDRAQLKAALQDLEDRGIRRSSSKPNAS